MRAIIYLTNQMAISEDKGCNALAELICGYCSRDRERKYIVILQAFVDDSRSESADKEFVLAGYMTTALQWMKFSDEWTAVLNQAPKIESFHSIEALHLKGCFKGWRRADRDEKVMRLAEVIDRHPMASFDTRLSVASFKRILAPIAPYDLQNPYFVVFYGVMANAAGQLHANEINVPIDFIFDEHGAVGPDAALWYGYMKAMMAPHLRSLLGSAPIFRDDKKMVPLQAADMLAWHLRRSREPRFADEQRPITALIRKHLHTETWVPDEMLEAWAQAMSNVPGIEGAQKKSESVKPFAKALNARVAQIPEHERHAAYEQFARAMDSILRANPAEVRAMMEAEKAANAEKRKAKKQLSASGRASTAKD